MNRVQPAELRLALRQTVGMRSWPAPRAKHAVHASVSLPGSKSLTNRLLLLGALADAPTRLVAPLRARDTRLMADAVRVLGVDVHDDGDDVVVTPNALQGGRIDVGLAGTVMRFVPPVAALADGAVAFDGDEYARNRPMTNLLDGLRQLGAQIDDGGTGRLPFTVHGTGAVPGGQVRIDASATSQFVSGLLLAAARFDNGVEVVHAADRPVPSLPHIDMTIDVLRRAGVQAEQSASGIWQVAPGPISGGTHEIEPDLSNAAPFAAAAMVTDGEVRIPHWPHTTTQAGDALRELLAAMGADIALDADGLRVRGTGAITGIDANLRDVTELVTVIAALAALADSPSELTGLGHMRGHETDRLAALYAELSALGCDVTEHADGLTIRPTTLHGGTWHAYADHRMATAGVVLGLAVDGVEIDDIASTTKTLPDFPGLWSAMLAG